MTATSFVPFADLSIQWREIRERALPDLERLFEASAFCLGPWVTEFETRIASLLGARHAVAVSSGSAALHLAVLAAGIGPGDRVLVPAHSFIGTLWGVIYAGATPVFCDVEPDTGTIDIADAERRIGAGAKAIIPVHLYGQPADMAAVRRFAQRRGLIVIEDVAQAIGASYEGKALGTHGAFGCFSFYPGKNLGGAGEGGLVITDDDGAAASLKMLREHGQAERYVHAHVGFNYRMDGIQGLILNHKLDHLARWTDERRAIAARYDSAFRELPLRLPRARHGDHVFHLYVVRTERRDALRTALDAAGIQTGLHYPVPLHRQPCLKQWATGQDAFPVAEDFAGMGLSLPIFAGMSSGQQDRVITAVRHFFGSQDPLR
ncbi:DegT/DnrJ/EryC1/StrS family aminotransferase [Lichenifustis flavocetrariae]|uniref:DegT/DnrJ/EryC1/StrS family aminotransferase n=1 Tax=Lichenifustis flavocetrariae TaxID=2949735 RepID=A0AA42CIM2_9HYPH|nr:DegT/DnrJ/EryC1/StrS family aminotransferase [Lichenifustis flavocetrariae]MCW6508539.1 DegT/DnrJ/EryC1/StrS family aminotransferase [Lichenifustis flavocetrariae]